MYAIASGAFSPIENPLPNPRVIRAVEGAGSEICAGLESTYASFVVLKERSQILIKAVAGYDELIAQIKDGSILT